MRIWSGARVLATSLGVVGFLFAAVFPTRTYLAQRNEIAQARQRLEVLGEQNRLLQSQVGRLESDEEIERLARAEHNLVRPGEEAYAIVSSPAAGSEEDPVSARVTDRAPTAGSSLGRLVARVISGIL